MTSSLIETRLSKLEEEHKQISQNIQTLQIQLQQLNSKRLEIEGAFKELNEIKKQIEDEVTSADSCECDRNN